MSITQTKQKVAEAYTALKESQGYKNKMQAPKLVKIVLNVGTGRRARTYPQIQNIVEDRIAKITGQKPTKRTARMSIAGFKLRQGDTVGYAVTLRGDKMYAFFDKLVHIAFPRTKDFRGISKTTVDKMGNLTVGLKEHNVFPETVEEDLVNVFGMSITVVSTAKNKKEATDFFTYLGFPFKKEEDSKKK